MSSDVQNALTKANSALQIEQYKGTVTGVKLNGTTKSPSNGVVDLGNVATTEYTNTNFVKKLGQDEEITINNSCNNGDCTTNLSLKCVSDDSKFKLESWHQGEFSKISGDCRGSLDFTAATNVGDEGELVTSTLSLRHDSLKWNDKQLATEEYVDSKLGSVETLVLITHSELKTLRDNSQLIPGTFYRITDYECTTTQADSQSVNHPFDIIVQALDESTLSEDAQAIQHEGDEYFADAKLEAWKLKYTIDNDASRFAWAKELIIEQPARWSCGWGVLEEKNSADVSSNYEVATIDGEQKYLYRPVAPNNNFLREKITAEMFYRLIAGSSITSTDGFIYEADEPIIYNEAEGYYEGCPYEIRVKTSDGALVTTFINDCDNIYYDEDDYNDMREFSISFNDNEYEEVDGVYHLTPSKSDIDTWWNDYRGGEIITYEREYYTGSADALYYAFSNPLDKYNTTVTMVTDKNHLYQYMDTDYEDWEEEYRTLDYVTYEPYIAPREEGKGVIYRLIDEHNNDCPFDFKNMQFLHNGEWYYTFSYFGEDASLGDYCANNHLVIVSDQKDQNTVVTTTMPMLVFNLIHNASDKIIGGILNNDVQSSIAKGFIQGARISGNKWLPTGGGNNSYIKRFDIYSSGLIYGNIFRGYANGFVVGSADKPIEQFYGNTMTLSIINNFNITIDCTFFVGNTYNVLTSGSSAKSIVGGYIQNCYFDDYGNPDEKDKYGSYIAVKLKFESTQTDPNGLTTYAITNCYIRLFGALTIKYGNTTSKNAPLRFLNIDARGWGSGTSITIPSTFPANANYELKVAKNSKGEIKMWCDADLIA